MKNIAKKLIGLAALSTTIVPTAATITSCSGNNDALNAPNYLNVVNFDDVKIIDPISASDGKLEIDVSKIAEDKRYEAVFKQLATKYIDFIKKDTKYFQQDLIHYIWKAMKGIKSKIRDFQGSFVFELSNVSVNFDLSANHYFRTSFDVRYEANLTYNDYELAPYAGYQTQVDLKGTYSVNNLYVDIQYVKYEDNVASKATFDVVADPTLSNNPTTCKSTGKGKVTYYNENGVQTTVSRDDETFAYNTEVTESLISQCYYKDPIFCFAIYWYKYLCYSYSMDSYTLKNVTTKITK